MKIQRSLRQAIKLILRRFPSRGVWIVVFYIFPILFLHEIGHILACDVFGIEVSKVVLFGRNIGINHEWSTNQGVNIILGASGGLFAVLILLPAYVYFQSDIDFRMWIELLIIYQFINGIGEGFLHSCYMNNPARFNKTGLIISFLISIILYNRRYENNQFKDTNNN